MAFLMGREVQSVDAFNAQFSEQSPTESVYTDDVVQNAPIQPVVKEMESPEVVAPKKRRFFYTSAAPGRHTQSQPTQSKGWGGWDNWLKRRPLEPGRPSVTPQLFKVESPKVAPKPKATVAPKPKATVAPKPKATKPQPEVDETLDDLIEVRVDVSPPIVPKPEPLPASPTKREILRLSDDSLSSVQLRYLFLLEQLSASVEKIKEAETQLLNWETARNYPNAEKPAESEEEIRLKLRRLRAAYKKQCLRLLAYTTDKNVYHLTNGSILIGTQSGKSGSSLILTTNKGLRVVKRKEIAEASIREKKEISRCYFLIVHRLKIRMPTADPVNHISRIAEKVGISGGSQGLAVKILREAKRKRIIIGKDPLEIAATVLYIACHDPDGYCRRSRRNRGNHKEPEERSNGKTRFRGGSLIERRL